MAQATVELPEPATTDAANAGSADDLLSQMAGEEIDRLLADADKELAAGESAPVASATATEPSVDAGASLVTAPTPAVTAEVAKVESAAASLSATEVVAPIAAPAPAAAAPAKEASPEELAQAQLDALFNELSGGKPAEDTLASATENEGIAATQEDVDALLNAAANTVIPTEPAPPASPAASVVPPTATLAPPTDAQKAETLDAQLVQTLNDVAPSPVAPPAPVKKAEEATPHDQPLPSSPPEKEHGDPIYLKLLEMINAPLDSRPVLRDWIGKIGIVTAFNGFVILIYVFFFRG